MAERLDRLGIDVQLDASIDTRSHSGFWPARVGGHQPGFEFFVGSVPNVFGRAAPPGLAERDIAVDFVTHSERRGSHADRLSDGGAATTFVKFERQ